MCKAQLKPARTTPRAKIRAFDDEYLRNGRNATEAYIASRDSKRWKSAAEEGCNPLKVAVVAAILAADKRLAAIDRYAISRERAFAGLARLAFSSTEDYVRLRPDHATMARITRLQQTLGGCIDRLEDLGRVDPRFNRYEARRYTMWQRGSRALGVI
jgi:hypothetical protein